MGGKKDKYSLVLTEIRAIQDHKDHLVEWFSKGNFRKRHFDQANLYGILDKT